MAKRRNRAEMEQARSRERRVMRYWDGRRDRLFEELGRVVARYNPVTTKEYT